jgi:hypothetical protein
MGLLGAGFRKNNVFAKRSIGVTCVCWMGTRLLRQVRSLTLRNCFKPRCFWEAGSICPTYLLLDA